MQSLRFPILALGIILIMACGTSAPPKLSPLHIRQSSRHLNLAAELYIKGCYIRALEHYQQAHERYSASDQIEGIAHSLNGIANVYYRLGELPSAIRVYSEALETYALINALPGKVRVACNKAAVLIAAGRLDEAGTLLDQADQLAAADDIKPALRQKTRALLMMKRGNTSAAEELLKKALTAANDGEPDQISSTNYTMGRLLLSKQRPSQAMVYFNKSLSRDRSVGAYDDITQDLAALGECHAQLKQSSQAATHFKRSIKIYALLGNATKVQELSNLLKSLPLQNDSGVQTTLHWAAQWLAGHKEANLCR